MMLKVVNFVLFQLTWWLAIIGAAKGNGWWGLVGLVIALAWHFATEKHRIRELKVVAACAFLGIFVDSLQIALGVFDTPGLRPVPWVTPLWMVVLWVNFPPVLNRALEWLKPKYVLAGVLGLLGGPSTYYFGQRLGALQFGDPFWLTFTINCVAWTALMPAICWLTNFIEARHNAAAPSASSEKETPPAKTEGV